MIENIWKSFEANCWSRNLDYVNYIRLHKQRNMNHTPLNEDAYNSLCELLTKQMEKGN